MLEAAESQAAAAEAIPITQADDAVPKRKEESERLLQRRRLCGLVADDDAADIHAAIAPDRRLRTPPPMVRWRRTQRPAAPCAAWQRFGTL